MYVKDASETHDVLQKETIIYARPSLYSHWGVALLKWYSNLNITEVNYSLTLPTQYDKAKHENAYVIILIGYGLKDNQSDLIRNNFGDLADLPVTSVYHFNHYGSNLTNAGITSFVFEESNPLEIMMSFFAESSVVNLDENAKPVIDDVVEAINAYQNWTFKEDGNTLTSSLKWITDVWGGYIDTFNAPATTDELESNFELAIKRGKGREQEYLLSRVRQVKSFIVDGTQLFFVYAEEYISELANALINASNYDRCIVFIGQHTKGSDIIKVRTSKELSAIEVGKIFDERASGNDNASHFFAGNTPEELAQSLYSFYSEQPH